MAYFGICSGGVVAASFVYGQFPITQCSLRYEEALCCPNLKNVCEHFIPPLLKQPASD